MPIALLARPPQLLNTFGPTLHRRRRPNAPMPQCPNAPLRDVARHSRTLMPHHPLSPNQADDNPMGDIGKKISDFFSGLMPKEEEPPMCARWRRGGHLWRRSPLEDPPLEPPCGTPAGAPPPLEAPSTGLRHPGPMAVSLITWITTDPRLPHPTPLAHPPTPSGRGSLPCEPFPPPLVPRELRAPPSTTQSYTRHPRSDWHSLGLLWGTPRPDKAGPPTTGLP